MALKKILIDSDICLDSIMGRRPHVKNANKIFLAAENKRISAIVSAHSFSNIFYILKKISNPKKAVTQLKNLRKIAFVGKIKNSTIDKALASGWTDFEDAMQHFCAIEEGCEAIITRNTSDFKKSTLSVYTPAKFLETEGLI